MTNFVTAQIDYPSVARQVRDDGGLVEMLDALAEAFPVSGEGELFGPEEVVPPEVVDFIEAIYVAIVHRKMP